MVDADITGFLSYFFVFSSLLTFPFVLLITDNPHKGAQNTHHTKHNTQYTIQQAYEHY